MIVDCHTHVWESADQLGRATTGTWRLQKLGSTRDGSDVGPPDASIDHHLKAGEPVDKSIVLAFKSRYLGAEIPNTFVAQFAKKHPDKLIAAAGIDPTDLSEAMEDVARAHKELGMKALTVSPASQDFHPADSRAMQVFAEAARLKMPVFVHQGFQLSVASKLEFARPVLLDEVARELPQLKLVIAHMGHPWIEECIVLLGKHENVFADISAVLHRPWLAYNALLSAYHYGVMEKLLFGSGFPYATPAGAIESLYRINQLVTGTNLPTVPRPQLVKIVERDALALLGIAAASTPAAAARPGLLDASES